MIHDSQDGLCDSFRGRSAGPSMRLPDEDRDPLSGRKKRKWDRIITLFMENRIDELASYHRAGTRGRILSVLAIDLFDKLQIPFRPEPIFHHVEPNPWYREFAQLHGIKLRTHEIYNPDMFLENGTWVEVTLSENTAYKKLFRYGHQTDNLLIYWLDRDHGFHKEQCHTVDFPNAEVRSIECHAPQQKKVPGGQGLIERFDLLKRLKGSIL